MKSLKAIRQLVRDTLHRFVRFFFHPIWGYSPSQILKAVQRDWEGPVFTGARTILGEMAKQNTRVMVYTFSEKDEPFLELECTARLPKPNPGHQGTTHLVRRTLDGVVQIQNREK